MHCKNVLGEVNSNGYDSHLSHTGRLSPAFQNQEIPMSREVVVVSGVRTAIGTYGGSLKDTPPTELAAQVVRESLVTMCIGGGQGIAAIFERVS